MMLSSPAKRRKTSTTTSVNVSGNNTDLEEQLKPTTPTRASYLSPTKASLACSHPHLAHQNQLRSLTEPRGRQLKDDLLKAKSTAQDSNAGTTTDQRELAKLQGIVQEVAQPNSTSTVPRTEPRPWPPLENRQPSNRHPATGQDFLQPPIVPKLVKRFQGSTPARAPSPPGQPQLPPTPVELGLEEAPERAKGLSSSSPRGSKSGSGRHRQRLREGQSITSSPLKPKNRRPVTKDIHDRENEAEIAEVEPRPQVTAQAMDDATQRPRELYERQTMLKNLKADLLAVKKSSVSLERALNSNDVEPDILDDHNSLSQIRAGLEQKSSTNTKFEQTFASDKEALQYLDLFVPANLQLSGKTSTKVVKGRPKVVHHLTVAAPPPWPPHVFTTSFEVITDAETATVESIIWVDTLPGKNQSVGITNELFDWIDACMKSDFFGCNVGNLLWGLGQYFEKAVMKARAFWKLSKKYKVSQGRASSDTETPDSGTIEDGKPLGEDQALMLLRFLTMSQITIDLPTGDGEAGARTRRGKRAEPRIMLNWNIALSWNGVAKELHEATPSGIPDSAVQSIKELFEKLDTVQGFAKAVDAVYELVKGEKEATPAPSGFVSRQGSEIPGAKAKVKKRKRVT